MAKKQSRRSVSLSRTTYERLKAYCDTNSISMSQFVEGRIGDFLGARPAAAQALKSAPVLGAKKPEVAPPAPAKKTEDAPQPRRASADRIFTF